MLIFRDLGAMDERMFIFQGSGGTGSKHVDYSWGWDAPSVSSRTIYFRIFRNRESVAVFKQFDYVWNVLITMCFKRVCNSPISLCSSRKIGSSDVLE